MKITILADSNALPRGKSWGDLPLESTYPYLLDQQLKRKMGRYSPLVMERGMRYRTVIDVLGDWNEMVELRRPEYLVVQVGGADCAPRVLLPRERDWIKALPSRRLSQFLLKLEERYRRAILTRYPHRVCVPLDVFEQSVEELVRKTQAMESLRLIFINIFDPAPSVLHQFVGAHEKIREYNAVLERQKRHSQVSVIDLHSMVAALGGGEKVTVDGLHLNHEAQSQLAAKLEKTILDDFFRPDLSMRERHPDSPAWALSNPLLHLKPASLRAQAETLA